MFLKNNSPTKAIIVRTMVGRIALKPLECIELKEKLLSPIPTTLKQIEEEEYRSFRLGETKPNQETVELDQTNSNGLDGDTDQQDAELQNKIKENEKTIEALNVLKEELSGKEEITKDDIDNTIDKISQDIKDEGAIDFLKSLFKLNIADEPKDVELEEVEEEPKKQKKNKSEKALKAKKTTEDAEAQLIQTQIDDLKQSWVKTKQPSKKAKIQKQIQELQKQLDKIQ